MTPAAVSIAGTLSSIYSGYRERPTQSVIRERGDSYIWSEFPRLSYIRSAQQVRRAPDCMRQTCMRGWMHAAVGGEPCTARQYTSHAPHCSKQVKPRVRAA